MNKQRLLKYMPPVQWKTDMLKSNAVTDDIIAWMLQELPLAISQTKNIAVHFRGDTNRQTAANVWQFLKNEITYKEDGFWNQDLKTPTRLLTEGKGDCKSYALFAAGIFDNLGIPYTIRYVSYIPHNATPSHVYVVTGIKNTGYVVDGTWTGFNVEKPYKHKIDFDMNVRRLSGPGQPAMIGGFGDWLSNLGDTLKDTAGDVWDTTKTIAIAPARAAYLLLLSLNVRDWAGILAWADVNELRQKWENMGGDFSALTDAIAKGKNKAPLFQFNGPNGEDCEVWVNTWKGPQPIGYSGGIGEAVTVSTLLVSAAGVIAAVASIVKKAEEIRKAAKDAGSTVKTWFGSGDENKEDTGVVTISNDGFGSLGFFDAPDKPFEAVDVNPKDVVYVPELADKGLVQITPPAKKAEDTAVLVGGGLLLAKFAGLF